MHSIKITNDILKCEFRVSELFVEKCRLKFKLLIALINPKTRNTDFLDFILHLRGVKKTKSERSNKVKEPPTLILIKPSDYSFFSGVKKSKP